MMLLVFLTLFAATMSYISKLEAQASRNATFSIQTRMLAVTGLAEMIAILTKQLIPVLTPTSILPPSTNPTTNTTTTSPTLPVPLPTPLGVSPMRFPNAPFSVPGGIPTPFSRLRRPAPPTEPRLANVQVRDMGALIPLNAIAAYDPIPAATSAAAAPPWIPQRFPIRSFANLIATVTGLDSSSALIAANGILRVRLGPDGRPGRANVDDDGAERFLIDSLQAPPTGRFTPPGVPGVPGRNQFTPRPEEIDDPGELQADIRRGPYGDDTPFARVQDLKRVPGMTPMIFQAIEPYVTAFSSNMEIWQDAAGAVYARVPLNESNAQTIADALARLKPYVDENMRLQFAANLVDRRDSDNIPTVLRDIPGSYPIIGYERGLIISEVCPDVMTMDEDDDNGEYIEIYNPLNEAVDLTNWRVDWGEGQELLTGSIPPRGFLILTDDIKNDNDSTPEDDAPGMGSFYDVFRTVPTGGDRIAEAVGMDLPNSSGIVYLYDNRGNLRDYLAYDSASFNGLSRGFHKPNPFSHVARPAEATPYGHDLQTPQDPYEQKCWNILMARMNVPFQSEAEALTVPIVYALPGGGEGKTNGFFPRFGMGDPSRLDLRLLDCFTVSKLPSPVVAGGTFAALNLGLLASSTTASLPVAFGKINLKSSPVEIMAVLPGMSPAVAQQAAGLRMALQVNPYAVMTSETQAFQSIAHFANSATVWAGVDKPTRLVFLVNLCPLVTFNSTTFEITATNRSDVPAGRTGKKHLSCRALVNLMPSGAEIIEWHYLPMKR